MGAMKQGLLQRRRESMRKLRGGDHGLSGSALQDAVDKAVPQTDGGHPSGQAGPSQNQTARARGREKITGNKGFDLATLAIAKGQGDTATQGQYGEQAGKVKALGAAYGGGDLLKGGSAAERKRLRNALRVARYLKAAGSGGSSSTSSGAGY